MKEHTRWVLRSGLTPDAIVAALTTFTDDRVRIWRETSHPAVYGVHEVGAGWAEVTEGVPYAWSRERYDWSVPRIVSLRQLESNIAIPTEGRISPDLTGMRRHIGHNGPRAHVPPCRHAMTTRDSSARRCA